MPPPILIADPDDPRVADYRHVKERDLVGRRGLFVAEGSVVLRSLVISPSFEPVSFLIAEHRADALAPIVKAAARAPVYLAPQALMDVIAGFAIHRGVLGIGRRRSPAPKIDALLGGLGDRALLLVACGIGNHDNMAVSSAMRPPSGSTPCCWMKRAATPSIAKP